jgi:hypothetical protein
VIDRRTALTLVATIFGVQRAPISPQATCRLPETLVLDLGAGACSVKRVRVQQGALSADVNVEQLIQALKS